MRTDPEIRAVLLPEIRAARPGALIVQEWGINYNLVADIAAIGDQLIESWEIKSAADSTTRLARQVPLYSALFDRCTLVTAPNHLKHVRCLLPDWWGIVVCVEGATVIDRAAVQNPSPYSTTGLLWASEANQIARTLAVRSRATEEELEKSRTLSRMLRRRVAPPRIGKRELLRLLSGEPREHTAPLVRAAILARKCWRRPDGYRTERREPQIAS